MVTGLELFREHFKEYSDHYILIGGTACDISFAEKTLPFRQTKDLDIILVVEALTDGFVAHFWKFIRTGGYKIKQVDNHTQFYRFTEPANKAYPFMLELFARRPEILHPAEGVHITRIPTGEDLSSLSAILMDNDYYGFTLSNSTYSEGAHRANDLALIALKAKAFLNNRQLKQNGRKIQEKDIIKHKNDVIRLAAIIPPADARDASGNIRQDILTFIDVLREEPDNVKGVLSPLGAGNLTKEDIIGQLRQLFRLP